MMNKTVWPNVVSSFLVVQQVIFLFRLNISLTLSDVSLLIVGFALCTCWNLDLICLDDSMMKTALI